MDTKQEATQKETLRPEQVLAAIGNSIMLGAQLSAALSGLPRTPMSEQIMVQIAWLHGANVARHAPKLAAWLATVDSAIGVSTEAASRALTDELHRRGTLPPEAEEDGR